MSDHQDPLSVRLPENDRPPVAALVELAQTSPAALETLNRARSVGTPPEVEGFAENGYVIYRGGGTPRGDLRNHVMLLNTFGTAAADFAAAQLGALEHATRHRGEAQGEVTALNGALAFVRGANPDDELQAALATQMAAVHSLAMETLGRARHAAELDVLERYAALATRLNRTFVAQVEALAKLQGGGQQQVEVRHVHVDARNSQNVIGDLSGAGDGTRKRTQRHAPLTRCPAPGVAALPGADPLGLALPGAGDQWPEAVPDARGEKSRRPDRPAQRRVAQRAVDERSESSPRRGRSARAGLPRGARLTPAPNTDTPAATPQIEREEP